MNTGLSTAKALLIYDRLFPPFLLLFINLPKLYSREIHIAPERKRPSGAWPFRLH